MSTVDTITNRSVHKIAFPNLLCRTLTDSFSSAFSNSRSLAFFYTLSRADSFRDSVAYLLRNLITLAVILYLALPVSNSITNPIGNSLAFFFMLHLLNRLLDTLAFHFRRIVAFFFKLNSALVPGYSFKLGFIHGVAHLFLGGGALLVVFSLAFLLIVGGAFLLVVSGALLVILSGAFFLVVGVALLLRYILALLLRYSRSDRYLDSVAFLFRLLVALLLLYCSAFLTGYMLNLNSIQKILKLTRLTQNQI